jgi:hypothetical protein
MSENASLLEREFQILEFSGFPLQDGAGQAYHEEAFHHFLEMERKRSEASNRPFLLLLVDFKRRVGRDTSLDTVTEPMLFSTLSGCLRETDFVGWYRDGRVAGAVLTQHGEPEGDDIPELVRQRVAEELGRQLPFHVARDLQVRVYQLSPNGFRSES